MSVDFIDSNVFVYLFDEIDTGKRERAQTLIHRALLRRTACISFQVVQETLNVLTRKLPVPLEADDARLFLERILVPLWRIGPSEQFYRHGLELQARYRYGLYDALIIAAALSVGCTTLYSEDLQHDQRIEGLRICNPFVGT
ncbi:MAG: PIN domain-containing protein [Candidatus Competibacterales bacterium]|nr:PIN domain-containing protein [Candidatus Competibacterales bacterium]